MIFAIGSAAYLFLVIFALVDIIGGNGSHIRNLDKMTWVFIVIVVPLIGSIAWFLAGREYGSSSGSLGSFGDPRRAQAAGFTAPLSTEAELAALDAEISRAEKDAKLRRLEAELERKRGGEA
jgi:hypothetical protein